MTLRSLPDRGSDPTRDPGTERGIPDEVPLGRRRPSARRPAVVAGVTFVLALGVFLALSPRVPRSVPALALRRALPAGAVLDAGDLHVVSLPAGTPVDHLVPADLPALVGHRLEVALPAGTLVVSSELQSATPAGTTVGLATKAGQVPLGLVVGDEVTVLCGLGTTAASAPSPVAVRGVVTALAGTAAAGEVLSVRVPSVDAVVVAAASASGDYEVVAP